MAGALVFDTGELDEEEALVSSQAGLEISWMSTCPPKDCRDHERSDYCAADQTSTKDSKKGVEFVPLISGMGSDGADWHANIIAKALADKTGGHYYMLHAPVLVKNEAAKEVLLNEPGIAMVLEKGGRCDVTILGIGQVNEKSASVVAGSLTVAEVEALRQAGAVASICGSYVAQSGAIVENDVTKRMIGQTLETIRSSKKVAVAVGADRADAIKAVLSGKHIDCLDY